jgi:hypothetical protein
LLIIVRLQPKWDNKYIYNKPIDIDGDGDLDFDRDLDGDIDLNDSKLDKCPKS